MISIYFKKNENQFIDLKIVHSYIIDYLHNRMCVKTGRINTH